MPAWKLAPSLVRLRQELNATWPRRDKASDGDIGDAAHRYSNSDHNVHLGYVHAIDVDKDGIDVRRVVAAAKAHPATHYVIFNRVIYTRESGFRARRYTGTNPHDHHIHISILRTNAARNSTRSWLGPAVVPPTPPVVKPPTRLFRILRLTQPPMRGEDVAAAQRALVRAKFPITPDGVFGVRTDAAIRAFQRRHGLTVDGVVGRATLAVLSRT